MASGSIARTGGREARQAVNRALAGPVMVKMAELVPDLAWVPKGRELETALRDCDLLHRCFVAFRIHRAAFRPLLLDAGNRPVENDNTPLVCGRTVNQVIAMIVRSAAKRHFRARLDGFPPGRAARLATPGGIGWGGLLDWMNDRVDDHREHKGRSAGDQLYDAIRRYLLHDWQVPIIPQYARMTPPEVRALGSRILDFRDAAELAEWLDGGADARGMPTEWIVEPVYQTPAAEISPAAVPEPEPEQDIAPFGPVMGAAALPGAPLVPMGDRPRLSEMLSDDGRMIRMQAVVPLLATPEIRAALGQPGREDLRRAARALAGTGAGTVRRLVADYGLAPAQMTAMLAKAALILPPAVYGRLFGPDGELLLILALIGRAKAAGLDPQASPAAFAAFMDDLLGRFAR